MPKTIEMGSIGPFKLRSGFARSTNLKADFAESTSLDHLIVSDKFEKHFSKLAGEIANEKSKSRVHVISGTPGVGKSTFALFLAKAVSGKDSGRLSRKILADSSLKKEFKTLYSETSRSRLLPVFLSGDEGELETALTNALSDALSRENMSKVLGSINALDGKAAMEIIKKWEDSYPKKYKDLQQFVGKKQNFKDFLSQLKRGTRTAISIFTDAIEELTGGATNFQLRSNVVSLYLAAADAIRKEGYRGIIVIYDEFGKFLERGIRHPANFDLHQLQEFAEACNSSGSNQLHLLLLSHLPISRYAANLPASVQAEWAKIEGRFSQVSFNDQQSSSYTLIGNVFEKGLSACDPRRYSKFRKDCGVWLAGTKRQNIFPVLQSTPDAESFLANCFPLHPAVSTLLPIIAERVAQNERTMFSFLTRNEDYSLPSHLANSRLSDLDLFGLENLYNYFRQLFANDLGVGGAARISVVADQVINSLSIDDKVGRDIVVALAFSGIINNRSIFRSSKKAIVALLECSYEALEIERSLKSLIEKRMIVFDHSNDEYSLFEGASVDIRSEIKKLRSQKLTPKGYQEILQKNLGLGYLTPKRYNFSHGITRFLLEEVITVNELTDGPLKDIDYQKEDGKIVYVAAFTKAEIESAKKFLKSYESDIIFVVPNRPLDIESDLLELSAIEQLYSKKELIASGLNVRKELDRYQQISKRAIARSCETLRSLNNMDATLICRSKDYRQTINCLFQVADFASDHMANVFPSYPLFNNEMINKRKVSTPVIQGRVRLMSAFSKANEKNWGIEGNGPELSILKSMLANNSIKYSCNSDGAVEGIILSSKSALYPLFESVQRDLQNASGPISVADILAKWSAPPFGIRSGLGSLYLFLLSKSAKSPISFYHEDTYLPVIDVELFESMLKQPKRYSLQQVAMTDELKDYLTKLRMIAGAYGSGTQIVKEAGFLATARAFSSFYASIPEYSRRSSALSVRQRRLVASLDSFRQPEQFFISTLPELYLGNSYNSASEGQLENLFASLREDFDFIQKLYADLLRTVSKKQRTALIRLHRAFGNPKIEIPEARAPLASLWKDLTATLPEGLRTFAFSSSAGRLVHRALQLEGTADNQRVIETLADAVTGANPKSWDEKGHTLFDLNLHQAINELIQIGLFLKDDRSRKCVYVTSSTQDGKPVTAELISTEDFSPEMADMAERLKKLTADLPKAEMNKVLIDLLLDLNNERGRFLNEEEDLPGANWG